MKIKLNQFAGTFVALSLLLTAAASFTLAAETSSEKQQKLIAILKSDAPPQEKAITCKRLAVYGTDEAVPVLAPLLTDEHLASWARIALEVIPGAAADNALIDAMGKTQGKLLVGVINSIAVRRDAKAVSPLIAKLKDADAAVASAAAVALGRIGGDEAAKALETTLSGAPAAVQPFVADGCIYCAEKYEAAGKMAQAIKLFDAVRNSAAPKHKKLTATRGAILARQDAGLPLLMEQLKSPDKANLSIGLRVARELPGQKVTEALAAEMLKTSFDRQPLMLLALSDRNDAAVMPAVMKAAAQGDKSLRLAAIHVLENLGNAASVGTLLDAAAGDDADLARAAKTTLARIQGNDVDAELIARLSISTGKLRQALVELTGQRRIDQALPAIVLCTADADAGIRAAAVKTIGSLGSDKQMTDLTALLGKTTDAKERDDIEKAILSICGRSKAACAPALLKLVKSDDSGLRVIALHALVSAGGADALAAVKNALNDKEEKVQDEAVRTLSNWPNNWPEDNGVAEPLLNLAQSGKKLAHQILGVRGYLHFVQGDKQFSDADKMAKINALLPLVKRNEEKFLAVEVVGSIPTSAALDQLILFTGDEAVSDEACAKITELAAKPMPGVSNEQRQKALKTALERTKNSDTKKKAEKLLK
jgi:HEAT repeat protein